MAKQPFTRGNKGNKRQPRKMPASLDKAVKMVKPIIRGRNNVYGMLSTNDRGDVTEVGVYNGVTKKYALYRSDLVDSETLSEFETIMNEHKEAKGV